MAGHSLAARLAASVVLVLALGPGDAAAEAIDGWELAENRKGCVVSKSYEDGTVISLSYDSVEKQGLLLAVNPRWRSVVKDREYPFEIQMPPATSWTLKGRGVTSEAANGFYVGFGGPLFVTEFMDGESIVLRTGRNLVGAFKLAGSYKAALALARCNARMAITVPDDPFAE